MATWDVHDYGDWIRQARKRIAEDPIAEEDKELLLAFDRFCVVQGLSVPRRAKLLRHLRDAAREFLPVPFRQATKHDLQEAIARLESRAGYSLWTKHDVKIALRKFYKWLVFGDDALTREDWPEIVAWIKPAMKRRDLCRVRAADLLTTDEVERIVQGSQNPRNRAFLAVLYEIGGRIGEVGCLRVGDVTRDEYSLLLDLDGKTGKRTVRVVQYASHLVAWLNLHPGRADPGRPLWPSLRPPTYLQPLPYREFSSWIKRAAQDAGVTKRIYPHLFRHSRATHLLASGSLNEAQAKVFFGWVADSRILSTYAHLVTKDANDAILRMYGVQHGQEAKRALGLTCGMCQAPNPTGAALCYRCGYALGITAADDVRARTDRAEDLMARFLARPEVRELFKAMVRDELRHENSAPPPPSPPRPAPRPEDDRAAA
ncbi:MAG: tyrosine-type recombinase/integrase [Candidatus Aenigmarchaeota archaeon]|nr:tyrosine-type recombinase/integrase [Candidatus Aenigmarchaeota archaeon]